MAPYIRIEGPEKLTFGNDEHVTSPDLYLSWHLMQVMQRNTAQRWAVIVPVYAYIEHGRWVAKCLGCSEVMLTKPEWGIACCAECGGVHHRVMFPDDFEKIEQILLQRPVRKTQNWLVTETVDDLLRENESHREEIEHHSCISGGTF